MHAPRTYVVQAPASSRRASLCSRIERVGGEGTRVVARSEDEAAVPDGASENGRPDLLFVDASGAESALPALLQPVRRPPTIVLHDGGDPDWQAACLDAGAAAVVRWDDADDRRLADVLANARGDAHAADAQSMRALWRYAEDALERERSGLSRMAHDVLGQALTAVRMELAWIERRIAAPDAPEPVRDDVMVRVESIRAVVDDTIAHVRRLSTYLRPSLLDDLGLGPALAWLAQDSERQGVPCSLYVSAGTTLPDGDAAVALYRALQDVLMFARESPGAAVHIDAREADGRMALRCTLRGAAPTAERRHLAVLALRERLRPWAGEVAASAVDSSEFILSFSMLPEALGVSPAP